MCIGTRLLVWCPIGHDTLISRCPDYVHRYDVKQPDHAVLVIGDSGGGIGTCEFFTATSSFFPAKSSTTCRNQGGWNLLM